MSEFITQKTCEGYCNGWADTRIVSSTLKKDKRGDADGLLKVGECPVHWELIGGLFLRPQITDSG